jgi:protein ImuA
MPVAPSGTRLRLQGLPDITGQAAVWRADELARNVGATRPTGHAALDAVLPGGGWPVGALVEVLQPQAGQGEWRLLLPALGVGTPPAPSGGALVLVNPPHRPFVPALAAQGLDASRLLVLQGPMLARDAAARVWACEQALRCAGVSAVLAWLPQVRPEQLRRLQMAAQNFQQLLFVMRPLAAQQEASPAVLRLLLEPGEGADADALTLRLLKRRGPPLTTPLVLPARPERLQALLAASRQQSVRRRQGRGAATPPQPPVPLAPVKPVRFRRNEVVASVPASADLSALLNTRVPAGAVPSGGSGALDRLVAPAAR